MWPSTRASSGSATSAARRHHRRSGRTDRLTRSCRAGRVHHPGCLCVFALLAGPVVAPVFSQQLDLGRRALERGPSDRPGCTDLPSERGDGVSMYLEWPARPDYTDHEVSMVDDLPPAGIRGRGSSLMRPTSCASQPDPARTRTPQHHPEALAGDHRSLSGAPVPHRGRALAADAAGRPGVLVGRSRPDLGLAA